jgi:hypothetical protein
VENFNCVFSYFIIPMKATQSNITFFSGSIFLIDFLHITKHSTRITSASINFYVYFCTTNALQNIIILDKNKQNFLDICTAEVNLIIRTYTTRDWKIGKKIFGQTCFQEQF